MQFHGRFSRVFAAGPVAAAVVMTLAIAMAAAVAGPAPTKHTIYRCEAAGVTTFSDHPCGPGARTYEADTGGFSTYKPAPVTTPATRQPKRTRRSKQRQAAAAAAARKRARHEADCERMEKALRDIRSKMRAGYSAREGERLRARQAELREQRRSEHCR